MKKHTTVIFNTRNWLALLLVVSCSSYLSIQTLYAQVLTSYTFSSSSGTYSPISGGLSLGAAGVDDNVYLDPLMPGGVNTTAPTGPGLNIGFDFELNGIIYDRIGISTNGWAALGQSALTPSINMINALNAEYSYAVMSEGFSSQPAVLQNRIVAFNTDLEMTAVSNIRIQTIGTSPSRTCVIQWTGMRKYTSGTSADDFNFQLRLHETTNTIEYVYGSFVADAANNPTAVGIRLGSSFTARTSTTSWSSSTAATLNTETMTLTDVILPSAGLSYVFTPVPKTYASSIVTTASTSSVAPGTINKEMVKINIAVTGISSTLDLTSMNVSTNGSTSLADIVNVNVYYTGGSNAFSTATTFGSAASPLLNNTVTGSISLQPGNNYFWVAYDVSSGAALGNTLDAEITSVTVGGTPYVPTVTAPPGNVQIAAPMTYISSTSTQITSRVEQGSVDNKIIRIQVETSASGSPSILSQLDFNANGTTDTANISNIKVWYTGNSNAFATTTQFGTTLPNLPGLSAFDFSVAGTQTLLNNTNYFWLTYDVKPGATIGNVVDAEVTSVTFEGTLYTPTITAPAGSREIKAAYCSSSATSIYEEEIGQVTMSSNSVQLLDNGIGCTPVVSNPLATAMYTNYTTLAPMQINRLGQVDFTICQVSNAGTSYVGHAAIYIDYTQDGDFNDPGEMVWRSLVPTPSTSTPAPGQKQFTGSFTIPCGAVLGETRMRIVLIETATPLTPSEACGGYTWGETEDYTIEIGDNPIVYRSSTAVQQTGVVGPGATGLAILRIPVKATGCGTLDVTQFDLSTVGTTTASDLTSASIYYTGNSKVFATTSLFGTIPSPSGAFTITGTQALAGNPADTDNFWLVYDIAPGAALGNIIDAQVTGITVDGNVQVPAVTNPAGNYVITAPMTYVSSTSTQITSRVEQGSVNNKIIGIQVVSSATGSSSVLSQLDFNADGTTDTANISNIKVWYTGNSNVFTTTTQFGTTLPNLPGLSAYDFSIAGSQVLLNNTNYFWLTYDVKPGATVGNVVDAEVTSVTFEGTAYTPTITAPAGNREIKAAYCASSASSTAEEDIGQVTMSSNSVQLLNNGIGCTPVVSNPLATATYTNYTALGAMQVTKLNQVDFTICQVSNAGTSYQGHAAIYIDYTQDGDFNDPGEMVWNSALPTPSTSTPAPGEKQFTGSFTIPCGAALGETRMRIVLIETGTVLTPAQACGGYTWGETEDYTIEILDNPMVYQLSTAIQQTGVASPGTSDLAILRIPVKAAGCSALDVTQFNLSTVGTTTASNLTSARIYYTGNSKVFTPLTLFGTTPSPSGAFTITGTQALAGNPTDTNNFWLVYDIAPGAALGNTIDAQVTGITVGGIVQIPTVTNPAGNYVIATPMTYLGSTASQKDTSKVGQGNTNRQILNIQVVTSSTGAPINLTQLNLNPTGTTDIADVENIRVWYTGNSRTFATTVQFGATLPLLPGATPYSIAGNILLANDTNNFWLTYDIPGTAVIGNYVDGEVTGITVAGTSYTPAVSAPAGSRQIRAEFCMPVYSNGAGACPGSYYINSVSTTGAVSNISNLANGCPGTSTQYTLFNNQTLVVAKSSTFSINIQDLYGNNGYTVWIDYNQDGVFSNATERVFSSPGSAQSATGSITVPCNAALGLTRIRVRSTWFGSPGDPCSDNYNGETEDYNMIILDNPATYAYSTAVQQTGTFLPGANDIKIMRIPVRANGCGTITATNLHFNTTGTTNASDILSAKLYVTGNSRTFNTSKLIGTIASPSGSFIFTVTDTLLNNDTTNYWLAYDASSGAAFSNTLDAIFDSIEVAGIYHIPAVGNPAGNIVLDGPITYLTSTVLQPATSMVGAGSANNYVAKLELTMSPTGAPVNVTSIDIATTGTTALTDIANLKVWYTGSSSIFNTSTQFGATLATPGATQTVTGNIPVVSGTSYFWVTYDVSPSATLTNVIDGEITSVTVDGSPQVPAVTAPAGSRAIRADFCIPVQSGGSEIETVIFNTLNNSNPVAPGSYYSILPQRGTSTTSVERGGVYDLTVNTTGGQPAIGSVWIDYNDDGVFSASEWLQISTSFTTQTIPVIIPMNATLGDIRMRIRTRATGNNNGSTDACTGFGSGEAEDYIITVLPAPAPSTYIWNRTGSAVYTTAANWTPARTQRNIQDVLIFNGGGSVTATGVEAIPVSTLVVDNNTTVTLTGSSVMLTALDALTLTSGKIIGTNVNFTLGTDGTTTGSLTGTGSIEGILTRWIAAATGSYSFPISVGSNSRAALVTYSAAPTTAGKLTIRFITGNPGTSGLPVVDAGLNLVNIADAGIWRATPDGNLAGGTYEVTMDANGIGGVSDYTLTALLSRANASSSWLAAGTHVSTGGSNAAMVMGRTGLTSYGEMGIAGEAANPLPVTLVSFTGAVKTADVVLSWTTASESNNKGFEVERSVDSRVFEFAGSVAGAGNSNSKLAYGLTDAKAFERAHSNVLYYRLKQVDADGKFTYSNTVRVQNNTEKATALSAYPNPFNSGYSVSFEAAGAGIVNLKMVDLQGKVVSEHTAAVTKGANMLTVENLTGVQAGIYFVKVTVDGETQVLKLVKN